MIGLRQSGQIPNPTINSRLGERAPDHERADLVIGPCAVDVVRELAHHGGIKRIQLFWSVKAKPSAGAFAFIEHLIHRIPVPPYMGSGRCGRAWLVPRRAPYS
jgi:hypothetical protein